MTKNPNQTTPQSLIDLTKIADEINAPPTQRKHEINETNNINTNSTPVTNENNESLFIKKEKKNINNNSEPNEETDNPKKKKKKTKYLQQIKKQEVKEKHIKTMMMTSRNQFLIPKTR
ncbi:hypothetical protein F8M41_003448 [Gigaspora margarita]|uniref:Uncharacterized protein n=1 Tax=Gigaspora margarita TaxID=4874 RepID=A0A8H4AY48_GIGMA|nr:hypothetical protein F8M41_003448 [Gigaspora margarita]